MIKARQPDWLIGGLIAVSIVVASVSPRTYAFTFPLIAILLIAVLRSQSDQPAGTVIQSALAISPFRWVVMSAAAFFAFGLASALWSADPLHVLEKAGIAALATFIVIAASALLFSAPTITKRRLAEGLFVGFLIGAAFAAVELFSGQQVKIGVINLLGFKPVEVNPAKLMTWDGDRLVAMNISAMTRPVLPIALMVFAATCACLASMSTKWRKPLAAIVMGLGVACVFLAESQTSKLAIVAALTVWGITALSARWAFRLMVAGWVSACFLIIPLAAALENFKPQGSAMIEREFEHGSGATRIAILNEYARHVAERPILGHGFNMSYILGPELDRQAKAEGRTDGTLMRRHPHNGYMQLWFELGAVGVALFCAFGVSLLLLASRLPPFTQQFAYPTFAAIAAGIAPSYGLWQYWFFATLCYVALLLTIALMAYNAQGDEPNVTAG